MIISNKEILNKVANHPDVLTTVLKLAPTDLENFKTILSWSDSLIANVSRDATFFTWLNSLSADERADIGTLINLDHSLLKRFAQNAEHLRVLRRFWDIAPDVDVFLNTYLTIMDHKDAFAVNAIDAFSQGQIDSKRWLLATLQKLDLDLGSVWILCGWIGVLGYLMLLKRDVLRFRTIRSFDIDVNCHFIAEQLNRESVKNNWLYKASTIDVNELVYVNGQYDTLRYDGSLVTVQESADTIINTSCDHMGMNKEWFDKIPYGKLVVLQNNNWAENSQHNNTVRSISEFKRQYKFSRLLYEGELDCQIYTRYMLVGIK